MTLPSLLFILLQLWSLQLTVLSSPVCSLDGLLAQSAYHLLRDLGGTFPHHCVKHNAKISFPDSVVNAPQCPQVLGLVFDTLEGAWNVSDEFNLTGGEAGLDWDQVKLDDFQNLQDQLLEQGGCLSRVRSSDLVSSYFDDVRDVLQQQDSTTCAWMALRRDLLWILRFALQGYHGCFTWRHAH